MAQSPLPTPTSPRARAMRLDALRGVAVLGILPLLIQVRAESWSASLNPASSGQLSGQNGIIWIITHILFTQKFMTIFAVLFGAGIAIMAANAGARAAPLHIRRMSGLLVLGLALTSFFWPSGVLALFALCGLIVLTVRKWSARRLMTRGALLLTFGSLCLLGASITAGAGNAAIDYWRFGDEPLNMFVPLSFVLRLLGLMLAGMALLKWGALNGAWPTSRYVMSITIAAFAGFPLIIYGILENVSHGWNMAYSIGIGAQFNYWGSLIVAGGYASFILLICKSARWRRVRTLLAATGRLALSNYIIQIIVLTWALHAYGPRPITQTDRLDQLLIAATIALSVLIFSSFWLRYFKFGPVEWAWRWASYGKRPPFIYMHRVFAPYIRPDNERNENPMRR